MQYSPFFILNRLVVLKNEKAVYDEKFHHGVNIIRGGNSSGKSTIAEFIFYALGGDVTKWKEAATFCNNIYAEVNLNGSIFTLKRSISDKSKSSMDIYAGTYDNACTDRLDSWTRYPYAATELKESFSQILLKELRIPFSKSQDNNSITFHQILRLLYIDQITSIDRLFRFDQFDSSSKRKAIGELLLGISDIELYEKRTRLIKLEAQINNIVT